MLAGSTAAHWKLSDLISAVTGDEEEAAAEKTESEYWLSRGEQEEGLSAWAVQKGAVKQRLTGHWGNGKTLLALWCGCIAAKTRQVVYLDLKSASGRLL